VCISAISVTGKNTGLRSNVQKNDDAIHPQWRQLIQAYFKSERGSDTPGMVLGNSDARPPQWHKLMEHGIGYRTDNQRLQRENDGLSTEVRNI